MEMTTASKDQITTVQATLIVVNAIIGSGVMTLSRDAGKAVGTPDAWISVILGGIIALFFGYVVTKLSQRFPGQTFYQYSQIVAGKFLGKIHGILLIVYFLSLGGFQMRAMGELVRMYLLDNTPIEVVMMVFLWVGLYLVDAGIQPIGRICELYFPITVIILLLTLALAWPIFEWDNVRPILGEGMVPALKGIKSTALAFTGFETMFFLPAFMKEPKKAVQAVLIGIGVPILLYTLVVFITIGSLTWDEEITLTWPLMSLAKAIDLPGGFFERFESLFSVLWVIKNYTAFVPNYYFACLGLEELCRKNYRVFMYGLLPMFYLVAIYPSNLNSVFKLGTYVGYEAIFVVGFTSIYFLIIAKVRRKGIEAI
jgi:spore germination protein